MDIQKLEVYKLRSFHVSNIILSWWRWEIAAKRKLTSWKIQFPITLLFSCNQEGKKHRKEGNFGCTQGSHIPFSSPPKELKMSETPWGSKCAYPCTLLYHCACDTWGRAVSRTKPSWLHAGESQLAVLLRWRFATRIARHHLMRQLPNNKGKEGRVCMSLLLGKFSDQFVPVLRPPVGVWAPQCSRCGFRSRVCCHHIYHTLTRVGRVHTAWLSLHTSWDAGSLDCIFIFSFK